MRKLFFTNYPFSWSADSLKGMFADFGQVEKIELCTNRFTQQLRGYGFVTMGSERSAAAALMGLNGYQCGGRAMVVDYAKERENGKRKVNFNGREIRRQNDQRAQI